MHVATTPPLELPLLLPLAPLLLPLLPPSPPPRRSPELPAELPPLLWPSLNEEPLPPPHAAIAIPTTPAMPATHFDERVRMECLFCPDGRNPFGPSI
jgi:hypothetical protein